MIRFFAALCAVLALGSVTQACPPSFNLNSYSVQQSNACYVAPIQQFQAYVAPVQSYAVPVQRVVVQKQFVQPVRQKVFVQRKAFAVQSYGVQAIAAPQVIQQTTVQRKGLFGLRKNKVQSTTIINP